MSVQRVANASTSTSKFEICNSSASCKPSLIPHELIHVILNYEFENDVMNFQRNYCEFKVIQVVDIIYIQKRVCMHGSISLFFPPKNAKNESRN